MLINNDNQRLISVLFLQLIPYSLVSSTDVLVNLPNGTIRGRVDFSPKNKTFYAFEKIPYAAAPVGDLRFQPPVPSKNWSGILNTTKYDVTCFGFSSGDPPFESEDCLYLNVYTPQLSDELLPVMIFIHGGGFKGGNRFIYGPNYLIENDVILVTFNYRLGVFGFLSTEDLVLPGNNGLKDQTFAIKWVHENINLFGGDPQKITIFGESSGAISVALHLLNLKSQGLFRAAIAQGGSSLSPLALQKNPREEAFKIAAKLNGTFRTKNDSQELVNFLRQIPANDLDKVAGDIMRKSFKMKNLLIQGLYCGPVMEPKHQGAFLSEKMYVSLKRGDFIRVPLLTGFTSEEAIHFALDMNNLRSIAKSFDENLETLVPGDMRIKDKHELQAMGRKIRDIYVANSTFQENMGKTIRFLSDSFVTRSDLKQAELLSKFIPVYFYQFSYDGRLGNLTLPGAIEGTDGNVTYFEDIHYLFYIKDENSDLSKFPESDRLTQRRMQKIWTDFAKYLNPTPTPSDLLQYIRWPKVNENGETKQRFHYVDIDTNLTIKSNPKWSFYQKWNDLYSTLNIDDFDTY